MNLASKTVWLLIVVIFCWQHFSRVEGAESSQARPAANQDQKQKQKRRKSSLGGSEPQPQGSLDQLSFVDAHLHLNDLEMAGKFMTARGITSAIVFWGRDSTNEDLAKAAKEQPERFFPFYSISPERKAYRGAWEKVDLGLLEQVDAALASGTFVGIGELSVTHFPSSNFPEASYGPLHPLALGLFELARKHGVPVNVHCEITDLEDFATVLDRFPDVTVIWAHGGYSPYVIAERMLKSHPNLIYELSARTWRHHPRSPEYTIYADDLNVWPRWLELIETHSKRFIVGTDAALHSLERSLDQAAGVQRLLEQLTPETRKSVAHGNIQRVLSGSD